EREVIGERLAGKSRLHPPRRHATGGHRVERGRVVEVAIVPAEAVDRNQQDARLGLLAARHGPRQGNEQRDAANEAPSRPHTTIMRRSAYLRSRIPSAAHQTRGTTTRWPAFTNGSSAIHACASSMLSVAITPMPRCVPPSSSGPARCSLPSRESR